MSQPHLVQDKMKRTFFQADASKPIRRWLGRLAGLFLLAGIALQAATGTEDWLGRWSLNIDTGNGSRGGWLEISPTVDAYDLRLIGLSGGIKSIAGVKADDGHFVFRSEDWFGRMEPVRYDLFLNKAEMTGAMIRETGGMLTIIGRRPPVLRRVGSQEWDEPIQLLEGGSMRMWTAEEGRSNVWSLAEGILSRRGEGAALRTIQPFTDFTLHCEFNASAGARGSVFLRGRYELFLDESPAATNAPTGSIGDYFRPASRLRGRPGEWIAMDVILVGRYISVAADGEKLCDQKEIPGVTSGARDSLEERPGPIYLQSTDGVQFRNITITPALSKKKH